MAAVEVFVVRLYGRRVERPHEFVGVVDLIGPKTRRSFATPEELLAILRDLHPPRRNSTLYIVKRKEDGQL